MRSLLFAILLAGLINISVQQDTPATTQSSVATNTSADTTSTTTTISTDNTSTTDAVVTGSTTTKASIIGTTTAGNIPGSTAASATADLQDRPVSKDCLSQYKTCTNSNAQSEVNSFKYCEAYNKSEACINSTSTKCNSTELEILEYLDCEPSKFFDTISAGCEGRITECLSIDKTAAGRIIASSTLTAFFCEVVKDKTCLTQNTRCTEDEYNAARKKAGCSSARALISSSLVMALVFLAQGIFQGC